MAINIRFEATGYRSPRHQDTKTLRLYPMYISEILQYLIWPAFIVLSWFAVKFALSVYEKKFPEKE